MEQPRKNSPKRSQTKIIPPKKKTENLSRDEVRSINKKRIRRKRKIKKMVTLFFLASVIMCAGVLLAVTVFFKINTVNITGAKVYANNRVLESADIEIGSSLFSVDEEKLNKDLPKKLPYIKSVKVVRKLPDTLILEITATRETAAFVSGAGYILIDDTGKVLDKDARMLRENVAVVSGAQPDNVTEGEVLSLGKEDVDEDFLTVLSTLQKSEFDGVNEIILTKDGEFKLIYEDRITIKLGSMENLDLKLQRAKVAIDKENQINPYSEGVLDLKTEPYAYFKAGAEEEESLPPEFVTDEEGNLVTDENGDYVTSVPEASQQTEGSAESEE